MTNAFRRHHKTIMWMIIVGTIVSFVYFLSPTARNQGGMGGASRRMVTHGSINGEPITEQQFDAALQEVRLDFRFSQGRWPTARDESSQTLTNLVYQRLFLQSELKQLKLDVTTDAAARYTRDMLRVPPGQPFPQDQFNQFVAKVLNQEGRVTLDDFDHYVRDQVGQQLLFSLFGMTGQLISQKEAEFFFRRDNEKMTVELARFPLTNFTDKVTFTPQDITNFYTNNQMVYSLPERQQINFIRFDLSNYYAVADKVLAGITNLDADIDTAYNNADAATFKDEAGVQLSPEAAKAKIKENERMRQAAHAALTNVNELANTLLSAHGKDQPLTKADWQSFAQTNGLALLTSEPFDRGNPPVDLQLSPNSLAIIFDPGFGDPDDPCKVLSGTNGYFLVGLEKKYPSEIQPLEAVQAKVTDDYRNQRAMELARNAGTNFEAAVNLGLMRGQNFDAVCAAQGVKPETLTEFSAVTTSIPEILDKQEFQVLVSVVYEVPTGRCSQFVPPQYGGFLAYVKSRTPLDDATVQRDIPTYLEKFRRKRQMDAFQEWFGREFQAHVVMAEKSAPTG